jgi:3-oxoacyl-[acyl-carrier protein] reductase
VSIVADASDLNYVEPVLARVQELWGGLDVVISTVSARKLAGDDDAWGATFATDLLGTVRLVRLALPALETSGRGAAIIIGSLASSEISPLIIDQFGGEQPYGAAKAALVNYAKNMAVSLAKRGVRINVVSPGNVYVPGGAWDALKQSRPELYARMLAENPTGRMARATEVSDSVLFLASPRASFITGQNLIVDGGLGRSV